MSLKFSPDELLRRASHRVAMHMRGLWEERGSSDTRLLESFFLPDKLTIVGRSIKYDGSGRREHVIPRLVIVQECHRMLAAGVSDADMARFIMEQVKIVLISHEECVRLDSASGLGLKQRMPLGWQFGDDPFARLRVANIDWEPMPLSKATSS